MEWDHLQKYATKYRAFRVAEYDFFKGRLDRIDQILAGRLESKNAEAWELIGEIQDKLLDLEDG